MKELGSEVAGSSKAIQRFHTKAKPIIKNGEFLGEHPFTWEVEKDVLFGRDSTKHSTRTVRPLDGPKHIQNCVSAFVERSDKDKDTDLQTAGGFHTTTRRRK